MAARLRFERAAPRRLRNDKVPAPIRAELEDLWDGIIADVYDEVAGLRRTKALKREVVERALLRVSGRVLQGQRAVIVAAVHYPLPGEDPRRHAALAGVGGGASAVAEEVAAFGTAGLAATVAIVAAVVGEVFETYVASSARTWQYHQAQRSPDPAVVVTDLAEAAGYGDSVGRRATSGVAHDAASWLGQHLLRRTTSRFARGLVPVVGVGVGAGMSVTNVRRVTRLPLRAVSEEEVWRLATDLMADEAYQADRARFLELTGDPLPPPPPPPPVSSNPD